MTDRKGDMCPSLRSGPQASGLPARLERSDARSAFSEKLKRARLDRELSQSGLARMCGLQAAAISHFEAGRRKPSYENLCALILALDVPASRLLPIRREITNSEAGKLLLNVMAQAESDLNAAHEEICKLQGLDPEKHHWPEWSSPANTLRWFTEIRRHLDESRSAEGVRTEGPDRAGGTPNNPAP